MRRKQRVLQRSGVFLALLLVLSVLHPNAAKAVAAGDETNVLTLTVAYDQVPVAQMPFQLYYVAEIEHDGTITPVEELQNAPISFELETSEEVKDCADTLDAYLVSQQKGRSHLEPIFSGSTNSTGHLTFEDLPDGLYLLVGSRVEQDGTTYVPATTLISLPQTGKDQTAVRDVQIAPKLELYYNKEPQLEKTQLTVQKRWENGENAADQPKEITVALYGNGKEYSQVTLSEETNWQYTWEDLDEGISWQVMELNVPEDYTVTVVPNGENYVITNTRKEITEDPEGSAEPNTTVSPEDDTKFTTPVNSNSPSEPTTSTTSSTSTNSTTPPTSSTSTTATSSTAQTTSAASTTTKIPQTGQLWWPVPLGGAIGLCFFLLGWGIWRKYR